ncbi:reverse transcriptase domain-containing protein [Tanacetum coccineum]
MMRSAITTVNAECSAIIMNKVPEKLEDPGKFLIPCALQELNRTSALADSGASINLLPYSIYKKLELEALTPTRMTLEIANRSITHPMGIAEDVVVRVDVDFRHEPEQNESSITFSPRSDPLHHEFAGEPLTLHVRNDREFEEYLSLMTVLYEISTSQGNIHQNSVIESLPISPIPVEDSEPTQEEIDILLIPDNLIPPGVEDADSEDEVTSPSNLDHH